MNKKQSTEIQYELCEYILQKYGVELYETPEIKSLVAKILKERKSSAPSPL